MELTGLRLPLDYRCDDAEGVLHTSIDEDLPGVKDWTPAAVQLRRGGEVVVSYPLLSAQLDAQ